jgi:hypothetical protein
MFALQLAIMPVYGPLLAQLSSLALKVLLGDSGSAIHWANSKMQCVYAGASYQVPFALEYFNIAVLAGLVLSLQRRGDWKTGVSTLLCLMGAVLLNATLVAATIHTMVSHGQQSLTAFLFIEKGLLLAVPFALWWIVAAERDLR